MVEMAVWVHVLTLVHRSHEGRAFLVEVQNRHSEHVTSCCCHMVRVEKPHFHLFLFLSHLSLSNLSACFIFSDTANLQSTLVSTAHQSLDAMAYRQLVEKYAKQLNDANGRIIDLETAIADRDAELEKTKVAETPKCEAPKVNEEDHVSKKQLEQTTKQANDLKTSLAKAQEELKSAKAANAALTTKLEYAKISFDNLLAVKGMGERELKDQIEELNNEIKSVNADRKVLNEIIIDLRKPVQDKQDKVADLERSVALEKKRR